MRSCYAPIHDRGVVKTTALAVKDPPLHLRSSGAPLTPIAEPQPGIADQAIAVPTLMTHYGTPLRMAQDETAE